MKKFFLFKREEPQEYHNSKSDTGEALSILAIPADSLSYMTAAKGSVDILFNNASPYEQSNLTDGESIEKTEVTVGCADGREAELMEAIMNFISRDSKQNIMRFDALEIANTFPENSGFTTINAKVRQNPVKRVDQSISTQTFIGVDNTTGALTPATTTIAGINFLNADNLPVIDYNEVVLEGKGYSAAATITHWDNDDDAVPGTGNVFDLHDTNTPKYREATTWISTPYADFNDSGTQNYFFLSVNASTPETLTVRGDYTMYMVAGILPGDAVTTAYSSTTTTDCSGPFPSTSAGGEVFFDFKNSTNENNFAFSTSSKFPGTYAGEYNSDNSLFVFVIRRDSNNVVTVYGRKGGILATIPANGSTDGELEINRIGGALGVSKLKLARFGVINKDMGNDFCVGLGPTLYNRYKV
jgi:hypothetical protein